MNIDSGTSVYGFLLVDASVMTPAGWLSPWQAGRLTKSCKLRSGR